MPSFAVDGGAAVIACRVVAVASLMQGFGTACFRLAVLPRLGRDEAARAERGMVRLLRAGLVLACVALCGWTLLTAARLAEATDVAQAARAVPALLDGTRFGGIVSAQFAAAAAGAWLACRPRVASVLSGSALALQAGHGHGYAMAGLGWMVAAAGLHLLAAGGWLGGLLPLWLAVRRAPPRIGAAAARWFSPFGKVCVVGVVITASLQGWSLVGDVPGLIGTAYGWVVGAKIALLAALTGFALVNRHRYAPALLGGDPDRARRRLLRSIAAQTGIGLLTVAAAGLLSALPPSIHEQPDWPFAWRPSLVALADPDLAAELSWGSLLLVGAVASVLAGVTWRRLRWIGAATALASGWLAWPHLGLLLVPAYPTSYARSPTGFAATAIARGGALFPERCAACHGAEGRGDGPLAARSTVPPADLTAGHLWEHADGELFWWISHGIDGPDGNPVMPGFAASLPDAATWALIDYVRAHNAGVALRDAGAWPHAVPAPDVALHCDGDGETSLGALRGRVLRIVADGGAPVPPMPDRAGVATTTVLLARDARPPAPGACVAADPAAWTAYATIAGLPADGLAGTQFLVDPRGWMRAVQRPGDEPRWVDPVALLAEVTAICTHGPAGQAVGHAHHGGR